MRYFLALSGVLLFSGCSTTLEPASPNLVDKVDPTKAIRINKGLSVSWEDSTQGGAAIRQSAYEHVLGDGEFYFEKQHGTPTGGIDGAIATVKKLSAPSSISEAPLNNFVDARKDNKTDAPVPRLSSSVGTNGNNSTSTGTEGTSNFKSYSIYELSRWERYCNKGLKMDEADWRFVTTEGIDNIPTGALGTCVPPAYTIDDYISSWNAFCSNATMKPDQYNIIKTTSRPASFGCSRLTNSKD